VDGQECEMRKQKYFRSVLIEDNTITTIMKRRIVIANWTMAHDK